MGLGLVAGSSPRVDGSNNKVLWKAKEFPSGANVTIEAHPYGQSQPVVTIAGGPSIVDMPAAGCWTFRLSWTSDGRHSSTINLNVLPVGRNPASWPNRLKAAYPTDPSWFTAACPSVEAHRTEGSARADEF